jgi:hypothetical protein
MEKEIKYDTEILEITVSLTANGFKVIINNLSFCKKTRLNKAYYEHKYMPRLYENELINGNSYTLNIENHNEFMYKKFSFPNDKEKSIHFLKDKILEKATEWKISIDRMIDSTKK